MKRIHATAIAVAVLAMSAPSLADVIVQDGKLAYLPQREVRFADLNLDSQEGLDRLNTRISIAVRSVCGQADIRLVRQVALVHDCRDESMARALADRDAILAARLAARGEPEKLAAVTTSIAIGAPMSR